MLQRYNSDGKKCKLICVGGREDTVHKAAAGHHS